MSDGTAKRIGATYEVRFERDLGHPVDKVWAALTEPEMVAEWLANEGGVIERRLGGRVYLPGDEIESTVTDFEEGRLIQYGWKTAEWDGGEVRWEVEAAGDATRLVLTHVFPAFSDEEAEEFRSKFELPDGWEPLPSTMAGWHTLLSRLANALDGTPLPGFMDHWQELNAHYKQVTDQTTS